MARNPLRASWILVLMLFFVGAAAPIGAQGRFIDNGDGTVTDTQLQLMWAKTDNQGDVTWKEAQRWCRTGPPHLIGRYDNWRMPTLEELRSLYVADPAYPGYETPCGQQVRITPEIELSCGWLWSGEQRSISARVFNFSRGYEYTDRMVHRRHYRALPVRNLNGQ
ncbi:Protein of unknown function [Desulfacinum hydrothermale DSM 13146]|uniref:Lcl C-terminal domain-containing protein n=1 Tax=Desulfacinum hydrothermale DSM 13146 TaxID=1121390 RepID=A0A1W1XB26_9BACT|nr:DUF1566 domain-containing protein [Desulfacinum hydrothermale]SMC21043.1 Protein of unknown function [Desulfacinum hydrothermale DSM 13146]